MKTIGTIFVLILMSFCALAQNNEPVGDSAAGQVVWWGDNFLHKIHDTHTNGLIENGNEFLNNVVAVASEGGTGFALKSDGTVFGFGPPYMPGHYDTTTAGLSNVVSILASGGYWAIKRDGTVAHWYNESSDSSNKVSRLHDITSIAWVRDRKYLALKSDGTILGFRFETPYQSGFPISPDIDSILPVRVHGIILSNVVALVSIPGTTVVTKVFTNGFETAWRAGLGIIVLKNDGTVLNLAVGQTTGTEWSEPPSRYDSADPVIIDGRALSNVVSLASGGGHCLALKSDGTVVAFGNNELGQTDVPVGLSNVIAIAAAPNNSLALKRDGTIVAWGDNQNGQMSVPAGLSNVVAIASGGGFGLAVITDSPPSSVFIQPHGQIEEMTAEADLVFKGQVISDIAITNSAFPTWGKPHATDFNVISVLKGNIQTNVVTFLHITGEPMGWGGGGIPSDHFFNTNQTCIIFAKGLDKSDYLFPAQPDATNHPNVFRQLYGGGVMHTLDARQLDNLSVKEALWLELNLLLNDSNPTNQLDALEILGSTSRFTWGRDVWQFGNDFNRQRVLTALLPLTTNQNEEVAVQALGRFATSTNAAVELRPFTNALITIANKSPSSKCRLAAIGALSGIDGEAVSNSLSFLLKDSDENVRAGAVSLLPRFPEEFAVQALREEVDDESANVRAVVADMIGNQKYERALPVLVKLFADPVGKNPLIKPMTMDYLKAGQRWSNGGDVHTSAGLALIKFAPNQVSDILKSNLDDEGFHINFVAKLAQGDPEPWLPELVSILETRRASVDDVLKSPPNDPKRYSAPGVNDRILIGTYTECWEDIRQYLLKKSPEELASGKFDRFMNLLETTVRPVPGCPGCGVQEARWLYQLYWTKNLAKRVANLRRQYDKTDGWWFDDFNNGIRGEADPVGAITF